MDVCQTTSEVIDALGGNNAVSELAHVKPKTVWHWRNIGAFPSNTFLLITEALARSGKAADYSLWGMKRETGQ